MGVQMGDPGFVVGIVFVNKCKVLFFFFFYYYYYY